MSGIVGKISSKCKRCGGDPYFGDGSAVDSGRLNLRRIPGPVGRSEPRGARAHETKERSPCRVELVGEAGFESAKSAEFTGFRDDSRTEGPPRVDVSAQELVAFGPPKTEGSSTVEDALARAIEGAVAAGRWDVVAQLARELEVRRLSARWGR
jgi:hypothetical protein